MRRLICLTATAMLLAPAAAWADGGAAVIRDCINHGDQITGHYTQQQYAQALAELPADVSEYTTCGDAIRRAALAAAGGHSGGRGAAAAAPTTNGLATASPSERAALRAAANAGSHPFDVGGRLVRPGVVAVRSSSVFNALPTSLLIALAALLATALGAGGHRVWTIVRARR